jgi:hypothetical protein
MEVKIETYRGWDILFDTEYETFKAESDFFDHRKEKKSYPSVKKYIDEYLKANLKFTPFIIEKIPSLYSRDGSKQEKRRVIGIRKDGVYVVESTRKGVTTEQISKYDEDKYCVMNPDNQQMYDKLAEWSEKDIALNNERRKIIETFKKGKSLEEMREQYKSLYD